MPQAQALQAQLRKLANVEVFSLLRYVQQSYVKDGCSHSAAALTYMSLFALVPLMTVMYAILSAIPAFQEVGMQIQELIFDNFIPSTGQEIEGYLQQFSQQARKLTGVGVAFLGVTAVLMLKNIEKSFNGIWKIRENRHGLSSFLLYWAILSLGPIFIGLALGISTYTASLKMMFDQVDVIGIGPQILRFTPYLLTSAAFTLIFAAVPNCRVPIKHAMIGGFATALVFEIAKQLFASIVANTSFQVIYGTFAAIPLFLLWIYLSWLMVLAGAELVHALSGYTPHRDQRFSDTTLGLGVLELLWRGHQQGELLSERQLLSQAQLFGRHRIASDRWIPIRDHLLDSGLLQTARSGDFILGRDLNHYTLWQLSCLLTQGRGLASEKLEPVNDQDPAWLINCNQVLQQTRDNNQQALSIPLATLFAAKLTSGTAADENPPANTTSTTTTDNSALER